MFGVELTDYDRQVFRSLADFLPKEIVDVHAHIWKKEFVTNPEGRGLVTWTNRVAEDCTIEDLLQTYTDLFEEKAVTPVLLGMPTAELDQTNAYTAECGGKYGYPTLFCTAHDTPAEAVWKALTSGGFAGLKPYLSNAAAYIPPHEIRIFDFLPHEHLEIADALGAVVMLHIARPERLKDPVNIAQLMEIDHRYPRAKVVVAHVGRAYIEEDLGDAFDILRYSENLLFDFSANTLDRAMEACIRAVGPRRVLFGSDLPISKMRMYRISEDGIYKNVVPRGLYGDVSGDKNMKESDEKNITLFIYEELLAFRRAAERLGLNQNDIEDIFCNNAKKLFPPA